MTETCDSLHGRDYWLGLCGAWQTRTEGGA